LHLSLLASHALRMARTMLHRRAVANRAQHRDGDRIDILVYLLWAVMLIVLLTYI
jgi:hypothetical protein